MNSMKLTIMPVGGALPAARYGRLNSSVSRPQTPTVRMAACLERWGLERWDLEPASGSVMPAV